MSPPPSPCHCNICIPVYFHSPWLPCNSRYCASSLVLPRRLFARMHLTGKGKKASKEAQISIFVKSKSAPSRAKDEMLNLRKQPPIPHRSNLLTHLWDHRDRLTLFNLHRTWRRKQKIVKSEISSCSSIEKNQHLRYGWSLQYHLHYHNTRTMQPGLAICGLGRLICCVSWNDDESRHEEIGGFNHGIGKDGYVKVWGRLWSRRCQP